MSGKRPRAWEMKAAISPWAPLTQWAPPELGDIRPQAYNMWPHINDSYFRELKEGEEVALMGLDEVESGKDQIEGGDPAFQIPPLGPPLFSFKPKPKPQTAPVGAGAGSEAAVLTSPSPAASADVSHAKPEHTAGAKDEGASKAQVKAEGSDEGSPEAPPVAVAVAVPVPAAEDKPEKLDLCGEWVGPIKMRKSGHIASLICRFVEPGDVPVREKDKSKAGGSAAAGDSQELPQSSDADGEQDKSAGEPLANLYQGKPFDVQVKVDQRSKKKVVKAAEKGVGDMVLLDFWPVSAAAEKKEEATKTIDPKKRKRAEEPSQPAAASGSPAETPGQPRRRAARLKSPPSAKSAKKTKQETKEVDEIRDAIEAAAMELAEMMELNKEVALKLCQVVKQDRDRARAAPEDKKLKSLDEWMRKMEVGREQREARQRRVDADMEAFCYVCGCGDSGPGDHIVFCERCDVAVHQSCYGVEKIPADDWYCHPCTEKINLGDGARIGDELPVKAKGPPDIMCALCPATGGAFHATDYHEGGSSEDAEDNGDEVEGSQHQHSMKWCHVACAKWNKLLIRKDRVVSCKTFIDKQKQLAAGYDRRQCIFCGGSQGGIIKCEVATCKACFHATCARHHSGDLCDVDRHNANGWKAYCPRHAVQHNNHNINAANGQPGGAGPYGAKPKMAGASGKARGSQGIGLPGKKAGRKSPHSTAIVSGMKWAEEMEASAVADIAPPLRESKLSFCHCCCISKALVVKCTYTGEAGDSPPCKLGYCLQCIAKHGVNPQTYLRAALVSLAGNTAIARGNVGLEWQCFKCQQRCVCPTCSIGKGGAYGRAANDRGDRGWPTATAGIGNGNGVRAKAEPLPRVPCVRHSKQYKPASHRMTTTNNRNLTGRFCQLCLKSETQGLWKCSGANCSVVVHWGCYNGSREAPTYTQGTFFCDHCLMNASTVAVALPTKGLQQGPSSPTLLAPPSGIPSAAPVHDQCVLCTCPHGPLKPTRDGGWVHAACALYTPEVFFEDPDFLMVNVKELHNRRRKVKCSLCGVAKTGSTVRCTFGDCDVAVHVSCALEAGFTLFAKGQITEASPEGFHLRCLSHRRVDDTLEHRLKALCLLRPLKERWEQRGQNIFRMHLSLWAVVLKHFGWLWATARQEVLEECRERIDAVRDFAVMVRSRTFPMQSAPQAFGARLGAILTSGALGAFDPQNISFLVEGLYMVYHMNPPAYALGDAGVPLPPGWGTKKKKRKSGSSGGSAPYPSPSASPAPAPLNTLLPGSSGTGSAIPGVSQEKQKLQEAPGLVPVAGVAKLDGGAGSGLETAEPAQSEKGNISPEKLQVPEPTPAADEKVQPNELGNDVGVMGVMGEELGGGNAEEGDVIMEEVDAQPRPQPSVSQGAGITSGITSGNGTTRSSASASASDKSNAPAREASGTGDAEGLERSNGSTEAVTATAAVATNPAPSAMGLLTSQSTPGVTVAAAASATSLLAGAGSAVAATGGLSSLGGANSKLSLGIGSSGFMGSGLGFGLGSHKIPSGIGHGNKQPVMNERVDPSQADKCKACSDAGEAGAGAGLFKLQCNSCQSWYHPWCLGYQFEKHRSVIVSPGGGEIPCTKEGLPKLRQWFCNNCCDLHTCVVAAGLTG